MQGEVGHAALVPIVAVPLSHAEFVQVQVGLVRREDVETKEPVEMGRIVEVVTGLVLALKGENIQVLVLEICHALAFE